ncbi:sensor domain-containing protein [Kitasatospora sp. LaBMicrA B282]|uniref:sensor domain-containing protein n=1 Tax=Kitasatospora sp. LaBMicrA B282 TaxID=3420949 RepID=UPI003D0FF0E5
MHPVLLRGPRLTLREFHHVPRDLDALHAMLGDPETARFLPFEPRDREDCADQLALYLEEAASRPRTVYRLAITLNRDGADAQDAHDAVPVGNAALGLDDTAAPGSAPADCGRADRGRGGGGRAGGGLTPPPVRRAAAYRPAAPPGRLMDMTTTSYLSTDEPYRASYFWRGPFARETYREFGYLIASLVTAVVGFVWTVTLFALGAGTLVTALGLPVLALLLAGARGLGAVERGRVARLLGVRLAGPARRRPTRPGLWGRITAQLADPAGWRAVAYQVLMFPWHVFCFALSVTLWSVGFAMALLPAYNWVFPTYVGWPGYRIFDYDSNGVHHTYYLQHFWQVGGASLVGILLIFLAAGVTHLLTNVSRRAAAALLAG